MIAKAKQTKKKAVRTGKAPPPKSTAKPAPAVKPAAKPAGKKPGPGTRSPKRIVKPAAKPPTHKLPGPARKKPAKKQPVKKALQEARRDPRGAAPSGVEDDRLLLPQKVCALVFDVTPQAIQQWAVKPRVKKGRLALYYLPDLAKFRDQQKDDHRTENLTEQRARLAAAQADKYELEVEQLRGALVPAAAILEAWEPIIGAARAKVLGLPSKLKTAIPKLTDKDLAKVKTLVRQVLEDLANGGLPKRIKRGRRASL